MQIVHINIYMEPGRHSIHRIQISRLRSRVESPFFVSNAFVASTLLNKSRHRLEVCQDYRQWTSSLEHQNVNNLFVSVPPQHSPFLSIF